MDDAIPITSRSALRHNDRLTPDGAYRPLGDEDDSEATESHTEDYTDDSAWQRVESYAEDEDHQSCYNYDCDGIYWSNGKEKVCGDCGHTTNPSGLSVDPWDVSAAEGRDRYTTDLLCYMDRYDRPQYDYSGDIRLVGGFEEPWEDHWEELDGGLLEAAGVVEDSF